MLFHSAVAQAHPATLFLEAVSGRPWNFVPPGSTWMAAGVKGIKSDWKPNVVERVRKQLWLEQSRAWQGRLSRPSEPVTVKQPVKLSVGVDLDAVETGSHVGGSENSTSLLQKNLSRWFMVHLQSCYSPDNDWFVFHLSGLLLFYLSESHINESLSLKTALAGLAQYIWDSPTLFSSVYS